jgi:MOSC domain-containing protein YiiM
VPSVLSTNRGAAVVIREGRRPTGIGKRPVDAIDVADPGPKRRGPAGVGFSGVAGDFVGNGRHHGGSGQAVYAFAREELDHWERELGRTIAPGLFGENLTTVGIDVDAAEQGDA